MRQHLALLAATALAFPVEALAQENAAAQPDRVGMARALEAAQAEVDGGVLEAELETEGGVLVYEIEIVQGSDIFEVNVNAETGEVVSQGEERFSSVLSGLFQEDELRAAQDASGTLGPVIAAIERQPGTQVEEIEFDDEDDRWVYELEIRDQMGEREVMIDAMTGESLADQG